MSDDLAKRAVACRHWRWMPGMRWIGSLSESVGRLGDVFSPVPGPVGAYLPDLTDPATLGCLLALVRELRPYACVEYCGGYWRVVDPQDERWDTDRGFGPWATEAAALVAALESAP